MIWVFLYNFLSSMLHKYTATLQEHLRNLDEKTKEMLVIVNQQIGVSLCLYIPDILVITGKASLYLQGNQVIRATR
jgi:hypothetical protein